MRYLKLAIIITVLVFACLFLRSTDWEKVGSSLKKVGFNFGWLLLSTCTSYFLGTVAWRYCMGNEGRKVNLFRLFFVRHIGETVGIINPASIVAGEATKVYLLRNEPVKKSTVVTSVLLSRILMMLTQVIAFCCTAAYMLFGKNAVKLHFGVRNGAVFSLVICVSIIVALIRFRRFIKALFLKTRTGKWVKNRTKKLRKKISEAGEAMSQFYSTNKKALAMAIVFFLLHWMAGSLEFYLILRMLGAEVSYIPVMFADMSVIVFKSAGAFVPAQIGVEEYGNKIMLAAIGITAMETWVTASVLRRSRQLFWIVFGLIAYFFVDRKKENIPPQEDGNPVCEP